MECLGPSKEFVPNLAQPGLEQFHKATASLPFLHLFFNKKLLILFVLWE